MAKDFYVTNVTRNAYATDILSRIDNGASSGQLRIYSGAVPTDADAAESANEQVAIDLQEPAFTGPTNGVLTLSGTPVGTAGVSPGNPATHFRIYDGDTGATRTCVCQGTVGTSDADLILSNVNIAENDEITLQTLTITVPNSLTQA